MTPNSNKPKHPGGRPTKLTPELQETICKAIAAGNYIETAAAVAGVSKDTVHEWLKQGARNRTGPYAEFSDAVQKALGQSEAWDVLNIGKAAQAGNWQASAWRLERKFPARWGRKEKLELSGSIDIASAIIKVCGSDTSGEGGSEDSGVPE